MLYEGTFTRSPCTKRRAAARTYDPRGRLTAPLDKEQIERGKLGLCIRVPGGRSDRGRCRTKREWGGGLEKVPRETERDRHAGRQWVTH